MTRIRLWTSATLSYAGRLQLIKAVLFAMQVYWSSKLTIPRATISNIESILASFLWKGPTLSRGGHKVSWKQVCKPLTEGGLGVKSLRDWNKAATMKHVWEILTRTKCLWVDWIKTHLLKGRSIWQVRMPANPSWTWRKILQVREHYRNLFTVKIGNGESTSLWFDYWMDGSQRPVDLLPFRQLATTGLPWTAKVSNIIEGRQWKLPEGSPSLQIIWNKIPPIVPTPQKEDKVVWEPHPKGIFMVASAWDITRTHHPPSAQYCLL